MSSGSVRDVLLTSRRVPFYLERQVRGLRSKMLGVVDALNHREENKGGKMVAVVVVLKCRACIASDAYQSPPNMLAFYTEL